MHGLKTVTRKRNSASAMNADEVEVQVEGLLITPVDSGCGKIGGGMGNACSKTDWSDPIAERLWRDGDRQTASLRCG